MNRKSRPESHWPGCERVHDLCRQQSERAIDISRNNAIRRTEISEKFRLGEIELDEALKQIKELGAG